MPVLLPKVVVVVVVELPALPNIVVAGPPVVPVVSLRVVDGAEVVVPEVVPEVVLRVDVRHEAHEDRADEQPARLKTYLTYSKCLREYNIWDRILILFIHVFYICCKARYLDN